MLKHAHNEQEPHSLPLADPAVPNSPVFNAAPSERETDTERLTEREVQEVVALWTQQKNDHQHRSELPRLTDVAAALDVSEAEARRLLAQARHARQEKSRHKRRRVAIAVSATLASLVGVGGVWNAQLARINQQAGPFTIVGSEVVPVPVEDSLHGSYGPGANVKRVDVLLRYNPPSLWRALAGPEWRPVEQWAYLTDGQGRKYDNFSQAASKGQVTGMTRGWLQARGGQVYSMGHAYPASRLPASAADLTLHYSVAVDDRSDVPFVVEVP